MYNILLAIVVYGKTYQRLTSCWIIYIFYHVFNYVYWYTTGMENYKKIKNCWVSEKDLVAGDRQVSEAGCAVWRLPPTTSATAALDEHRYHCTHMH